MSRSRGCADSIVVVVVVAAMFAFLLLVRVICGAAGSGADSGGSVLCLRLTCLLLLL